MAKGVEVVCEHCGGGVRVAATLLETSILCDVCGRTFVARHERAETPPGEIDVHADGAFEIVPGEAEDVWKCFQCKKYVSTDLEVCPHCGITPSGDPAYAHGVDMAKEEQRRLRLAMLKPKQERSRAITKGFIIVVALVTLQFGGLILFAPAVGVAGFFAGIISLVLLRRVYHDDMAVADAALVIVLDWLFLLGIGAFVACYGVAGLIVASPVIAFISIGLALLHFR